MEDVHKSPEYERRNVRENDQMRDDSTGIECTRNALRKRDFATSEEVHINSSYRTLEMESRCERIKSLARQRSAKRRIMNDNMPDMRICSTTASVTPEQI